MRRKRERYVHLKMGKHSKPEKRIQDFIKGLRETETWSTESRKLSATGEVSLEGENIF